VPLAPASGCWKPFPDDGILPYWLQPACARAFVRPPDGVYEPGGTDAKLTPAARKLLLAMAGDSVLHESPWRWMNWRLQMSGCEPVKLTRAAAGS